MKLAASMIAADAIVVASAPMRISLAGGGTDLPSYANHFGGTVVGLAIDRYVQVLCCPTGRAEQLDALLEGVEHIGHDELLEDAFTQAAVRRAGSPNVRLACVSDAAPRSGLGGSGAFLVSLLAALRGGVSAGPVALAEQASAVEMLDLSRMVGKQDHYLASLGGMRVLRIDRKGRVSPEAFAMSERFRHYVDKRLLLFHTGLQRDAGKVLARQDDQTRRADQDTVGRLHAIQELAHTLLSALKDDRVEEIGPILAEHWRCKAGLSDAVSVPHAVELLERAQAAGADGGKLVGAGGGGCLLLSCRPGRQTSVRQAMLAMGAVELPFGPSDIGVASRLVSVDQAGPNPGVLLASGSVDGSAA